MGELGGGSDISKAKEVDGLGEQGPLAAEHDPITGLEKDTVNISGTASL